LGEKASRAIPIWKPLRGTIGGFLLIGLTYLFSDQYLGLGTETIEACLEWRLVSPYVFLLKILFVSITLNFCGSGGIITPILFVGATVGNVFGQVLDLDLSLFSAIGMVSLLAGAANTPIAASIMSVELFGRQIAPYATISCITSFLMSGHRTVYPSQKLTVAKSALFVMDTDKEVREIHTYHIATQHLGLLNMVLDIFRRRKNPKG
jgi:H+/Cl- antiporter ClcA